MLKIGLSIPSIMASEDGSVFVRSGVLRSPFVITRTQAAGDQSSALAADGSSLAFYGADTPRFTGSAQRLLSEGQRTNGFINPRLEGAIPGIPGTTPTNTTTSFFQGLSREIVGTGSESNIPYVDVRFFGTAASGSFSRFGLGNALLGLNISGNATSTFSAFVRLIGGSFSQISSARLGINGRDAVGANVSDQNTTSSFTPTSASLGSQRRSVTWAPSDVTVIYGEWFIDIMRDSTATVDVTLRIGGIQHELGAFASSLNLPPVGTPGASTRGTDIDTAPLSSLGIGANGACTVLWSGLFSGFDGSIQSLLHIDDNSADNHMTFRVTPSQTFEVVRSTSGITAATTNAAMVVGQQYKIGITPNGSGLLSASINGAVPFNVAGCPTTGLLAFRLGNTASQNTPAFTETDRLRILPYSVPGATLQSLVSTL